MTIVLAKEFKEAKSSAFRRRIAALEKPLAERLIRVMKYCEAQYYAGYFSATGNTSHAVIAARDAKELELELRLRTGGLTPLDFWKLIQKQGVFFDPGGGLILGPLIGKIDFGSIGAFATALNSSSVDSSSAFLFRPGVSGSLSPPSYVLIDLSKVLENAMLIINLFRYGEFEKVCSILMTETEVSTGIPRQELLDRLGEIKPGVDPFEFILWLTRMGGSPNENMALQGFTGLRMAYRLFSETYAEDEVEHLTRMANMLVSSYLLCQFVGSLETNRILTGSREKDPLAAVLRSSPAIRSVSSLTDLVYGQTTSRLFGIFFEGLEGGHNPAVVFLAKNFIQPLLQKFGVFSTGLAVECVAKAMEVSVEQWRAEARILLDEYMMQTTGQTFLQNYPDFPGLVTQIQSFKPFTAESLPTIIHMWNRRDERMFTRYFN